MVRGIRVIADDKARVLRKMATFYDLWKVNKEAETERKLLQQEILEAYEQDEVKSRSFLRDGYRVKMTRVDNERVTIDEERLKKSLGAAVWEKVSTRTLDKAKLETAIAEGLVDPVEVAACSKNTPHPYVKVTETKAPDEEDEGDED